MSVIWNESQGTVPAPGSPGTPAPQVPTPGPQLPQPQKNAYNPTVNSPTYVDPSWTYTAPTQNDINNAPMPMYDIGGQPGAPGAAPISNYGQTDPNTGMPYGQQSGQGNDGFPYFLDPSQHQMDTRYLDAMRDIAFGDPGSSPWLKYQMQQDQIRQQADQDALQRQGMSSLATQQGQMAMRGGLTSGATERLGQQNLMGMIQGRSDLSRSAAAREAGYRQAAEQRQRDVLTQMPTVEQNYAQYGQDLQALSNRERNQAEAAKQLADAIRAQGGDPSMIESLLGGLTGGLGTVGDIVMSPFQIFNPGNY